MVSIYRKTTYDTGVIRMVGKCYPGNYGAPGQKRNRKQKRTPEDIRRQNYRNRCRKVQLLILSNFHPGDWHLVLKYGRDGRPGSYGEAVGQRRRFIDAMRTAYRKAGIPFKWIAVTERGKKGQVLHHHLVIEDIDRDGISTTDLVKKFWKHGGQFFSSLYEDGEYEDLAEYIVKSETKEECGWCTYSRSRNLSMPRPKVETIHRRRWRDPPVAPKGWYVVKGSVWNGTNPVTGYPVQHYILKRLVNTGKGGGGSG
ncbi:MAG: hypothetical protein NC489_25530 [Ruminococcus flavefaciens]|nr:hypothetical protein [Ruminococcus flavefaciens]